MAAEPRDGSSDGGGGRRCEVIGARCETLDARRERESVKKARWSRAGGGTVRRAAAEEAGHEYECQIRKADQESSSGSSSDSNSRAGERRSSQGRAELRGKSKPVT